MLTGVYALAWSISSSMIIIVNKHIMMLPISLSSTSSTTTITTTITRCAIGSGRTCGLGFTYPITLTFMGTAFSAIASTFVLSVEKIYTNNYLCGTDLKTSISYKFKGRKQQLKRSYLRSAGIGWHIYTTAIVPAAICSAITLVTGNYTYKFLSVSFIQMLKAFTPVVTMCIGMIIIDNGAFTEKNKKGL